MATGSGVTPAGLAWLFGEEEVSRTGRYNVRVPAGVEVDELALACTVVVRALWGLAERGLVRIAGVEVPRRRFLPTREDIPVVRVLVMGDLREPTVEGVLLGLFHGRAPVGRVSRALAGLPDVPVAPRDRTDLRAVIASGPPASGWLAACRREVEGVRREAVEPAYRASCEAWRETCERRRLLVDAVTRAVGEGIRAASLPR